jgi:Secretion system C-terminal sorting domain/Kelch motif
MTKMAKVFTFTSVFCLLFLAITQAQSWSTRRLADMPMPISNNAVSWGYNPNGDSCLYSFGGIDSSLIWSGITRKSFRYNIVTDVWDTIAPLPDTLGKIASAATKVGDTIYIIGGYHVLQNANEISSNRVHRYVTTTDSYLPDGAPVSFPIDDQVQCLWRDSLIYVITGWSNSGNTNKVQVYNPYTNTWQQGTPVGNNTQYKAFGASGIIFNDTIYYQGGASMSANFPAQTTLRKGIIDPLNPLNITWSLPLQQMGVASYRAVCLLDDFDWIHWVGGSDVSYNYNGIAYNGSGYVPITNYVRLYIPSQPLSGSTQIIDSLPMDLRGVVRLSVPVNFLHPYLIAGGMWTGSVVSNQTLELNWEQLWSVPENEQQVFVQLYPNPAKDQLLVKFNQNPTEAYTLHILDISGRIISEQKINPSENIIDTSTIPDGMYLIQIITNESSSTSRLIISH